MTDEEWCQKRAAELGIGPLALGQYDDGYDYTDGEDGIWFIVRDRQNAILVDGNATKEGAWRRAREQLQKRGAVVVVKG